MGTKTTGGQSWTADWTKFSNDYFKNVQNPTDDDLLVLETDAVIFADPAFKCALNLSTPAQSILPIPDFLKVLPQNTCCAHVPISVWWRRSMSGAALVQHEAQSGHSAPASLPTPESAEPHCAQTCRDAQHAELPGGEL